MCHELSKPYDLPRLQERMPAWSIAHVSEIASTNDWARREVESGSARTPALLITDWQSAGRGRGTKSWWSAPGNIAATMVFSQNPRVPVNLLPLLAGLAVRRALVRVTSCVDIQLKWPNDLVVGQRKLAGLLCERLRRADLIGVGINVNADTHVAPPELRSRITSLCVLTGSIWNLTDIIREIGQELQRAVSLESATAVRNMLDEYSQHHWPTGKDVELIDAEREPRIKGRCLGIDPQGQLILQTEQGTRSFFSGSIVLP